MAQNFKNFSKMWHKILKCFFETNRRKKTVPHEIVIFDLTFASASKNVVLVPHFCILCHIATRMHEKNAKLWFVPPPL